MKNLNLLLWILFPVLLFSQTQTENYIKTKVYKVPTLAVINTPTITQAAQNITYFDGIGRPIQQVAYKQSGSGKDIVTPIEYDGFGRQEKEYLPYEPTSPASMDYKSTALTDVMNFNQYIGKKPFTQKLFESSPLSRVLKQAAPGTTSDWALNSGHEIKLDYQTNIANEVKLYTAITTWNTATKLYDISLGNSTGDVFYEPNQLYKTITYDENTSATPTETNGSTVEFKNKQGQIVLKRTYESGLKHDTYYVYDDYGNLTYVLPPLPIQDNLGGPNSITTGYDDFYKYFNHYDFSGVGGGGGSVIVSIKNNVLTVTFNAGFGSTTLNTTPKDLPTNPCLIPDKYLGTICGGNYSVTITGGKLKLNYITGGPVTGFVATFTYNLPYTCTPRSTNLITENVLDDLCYQYKYDSRNRLVEKKLPAKQREYIVYDKLDRVVATGPALPPFTDIVGYDGPYYWLITKYDALNRPIYTGWEQSTESRYLKQGYQDALTTTLNETKQASGTIDGIQAYYSNTVAPTSFKLLTVNYYDDYMFPNPPTFPAYSYDGVSSFYNNSTMKPKGMATGSWTRVLSTSGSLVGETSYIIYDYKARPTTNYTSNYLGGFTRTDSKYDFTGKITATYTTHKRSSTATQTLVQEYFTYTPENRLFTHSHQVNSLPVELLATNTYDELGQLISKKVGNTTGVPVQKIDYNYNIRGWLTGINNIASLTQGADPKDLFAFKINYNSLSSGITGINALYNGNIAETQWATNSDNGIIRSYGYQYDNLNRLKNAIYKKSSGTLNSYGESLTYDRNGNIKHLTRYGSLADNTKTLIDDLTYNYSNNQLLKVTDVVANNANFIYEFKDSPANINNDYTYDLNGNMLKDANKGINNTNIIYNHLNLPTKITFDTKGNITYIYNALGQKVQKIVNATGQPAVTTDYLDGFQYEKIGRGTTDLKFFPTAEGYVEFSGSSYKYVYQYKDHLGNVRLSYKNIGTNTVPNLQIQEENNYYPFGLKQQGYNATPVFSHVALKYKYNGKELQDELGLNVYDYGFRQYMPDIGRFGNIDMLAELAYDQTPNRYAFNNPLRYIDLLGLWETTANGYKTNDPNDIKRFMSYLETENVTLNNSPTSAQQSAFIDGEMSPGGHGTLSNDSTLADEISISSDSNSNAKSFSNFWHGVQRSLTPKALDPRTIGVNLLDLSYPGGDNPKTYSGKYDYSYVPKSLAEYPAIGHDRRYDNLGTAGLSGLFNDSRAISTDYRFVTQELVVALLSTNIKTKMQATFLGGGLGVLASFKTIGHLANPFSGGFGTILFWDSVANKGVNNKPSIK